MALHFMGHLHLFKVGSNENGSILHSGTNLLCIYVNKPMGEGRIRPHMFF